MIVRAGYQRSEADLLFRVNGHAKDKRSRLSYRGEEREAGNCRRRHALKDYLHCNPNPMPGREKF